ncbi:DUF2958 family protein [Novosphingobium sp. PhB165]|uniref:DUF2958 domain-containing protein n=1 Tax=Novosphingobium sp. PhB165 TaxID=2485105 RepID=UPI0010539F9A|nr:DUF2958 domain-containing protein [Novosphingobium sp. PhB165]TCM12993.1 DUF2958 family protein [Novosphingobium sp. PhB165]
MTLLTRSIRAMLSANFEQCMENPKFDPLPLVRLFNPMGRAVWLVSELYADDDTLFGLADLGFGCPELGISSLREIEAIRLPMGLTIERDIAFSTRHRLSVWTEAARLAGSIPDAALLLDRLTREDPAAIRLSPR